jgi:hypothetical protein
MATACQHPRKLAGNRNKIDKMFINHGMGLEDRNGATNMSCGDTGVSIRKRVSCIFLLLILYTWGTLPVAQLVEALR